MDDECDCELEKDKAIIASRLAAFEKSPVWFTVWDILQKLLSVTFWLGFWFVFFWELKK